MIGAPEALPRRRNVDLSDMSDNAVTGRPLRARHYLIAAVILLGLPLLAVVGAAIGVWAWALHGVTFPTAKQVMSQRVIALQAADGQALQPKGTLQLPPIPVKAMPSEVVNAVLSIEDKRFYQRGPIDGRSVLRALMQNFEAGHIVAGGSTITQQLVKVLYLSPERTYKRKVQEAALAIWLDRNLTKDQILTSYLNSVYLGSGATGFPAAAKLYFNKDLKDLSLAEAAMLAGMINAPSQDDPLHNPIAARKRASAVIDAMLANGKITEASALKAKLTPATPNPAKLSPPAAGWFADWIYRNANTAVPRLAGAVTVHTTLDLRLQTVASNVVNTVLASAGAKVHATQAALVAMRPDGAVVAMVGGRDYSDSQFNRVTQAERQPGSLFKLFDYYAALRRGLTPDDTVLDEPVDIKGWQPEDDARRYHGRVTLATAFAHSYNDAAVRLTQQVGIPQVIAAARDLGLHAKLENNPSLALGTSEATLLDLTSAYAAVRAGVAPVRPWGIASVSLSDGQPSVPIGAPHEPQHKLGQYQNELIQLLRGVVVQGTGRAAALPGFAAGKTGTAQDYRDAWFIGFNDSLVVGVWVGNDDHSPMRNVVGGSLPATIWKSFLEQTDSASPPSASGQQTMPPPAPPQQTPPVAEQQAQPPIQGSGQNPVVVSTKCNIAVCERSYRSFRSSDCTYQPDEGGPRQFCDRTDEVTAGLGSSGDRKPSTPVPSSANRDGAEIPPAAGAPPHSANRQKASGQNPAQDNARVASGGAAGKCNIAACQHYSSFRASDCTYQPYGGGARRSCDRQSEKTAATQREEPDSSVSPVLDGRRADSDAEPLPDRDDPSAWPAAPPPPVGPLFDWGGRD
jgi:penicillin-binding protein 1A